MADRAFKRDGWPKEKERVVEARRPSEVEEGITVHGHSLDCMDYLHEVLGMMESGQADRLVPDPFYRSRNWDGVIPEERIDRLIEALDAEFAVEIGNHPQYHRNRSGATHTPDFCRLTATQRRAVAEELDRINARYEEPVREGC